MIKIVMVKYTIFYYHQKQILQQAIQAQQAYLQSVIVLCLSKKVHIITVMKECLSVGKRLILFKKLMKPSITTDSQF